jgi:septal ring factor EnvC (AmiA/AmiB activator)
MYNINYGQNMELLQRSENLAGYAQFVAKVRENEASMPLEQAVTEAVRYCIKNRILGRFLEEHGGEVKNMAFGEWDWDEAKAAWQEEAWEKAWEEAVEKTEEKYQPILAEKERENQQALAENQQALAEKQQALAEKERENQELRRKLQEAGIDI